MSISTRNLIKTGYRCPRRAFLSVNKPEAAKSKSVSIEQLQSLRVKELARALLGDGVNVPTNPNLKESAVGQSQLLLGNKDITRVYNAYFYSEVLTGSVDVLEREGDGWLLTTITIKSKVDGSHVNDAATQYLLAVEAGLNITRVRVMYINTRYVHSADSTYADFFSYEDITSRVNDLFDLGGNFKQVLMKGQPTTLPVIDMGSHCKSPSECGYKKYCESQLTDYPVHLLPRSSRAAPKLRENGIFDIRDIPADYLKSENHERVRVATIADRAILSPEAKIILDALPYPRTFIDFETIGLIVPIWEGVKPYQQVPFEWSCHTQTGPKDLAHSEFLDLSGNDPRRAFAESLIAACGQTGPVIVYNATFERRIMNELSVLFPDLKGALTAIIDRLFDLLTVVSKHYYHPAQRGSWSLKVILPLLAPELSYEALEGVQNGVDAQVAYYNAVTHAGNEDEKNIIRKQLLSYCDMDTLSMVVIINNICIPEKLAA